MDNDILNSVDILARATGSSQISWSDIPNTSCLTAEYLHSRFIICKYTFKENNKSVISFSFLDENNSIAGKINEYHEGESEFEKLNSLYELASRHILQTA